TRAGGLAALAAAVKAIAARYA
ncbi:cysteine desulfurase sulfur acceptor subunit CsdE, partial [Serratia marcescens]